MIVLRSARASFRKRPETEKGAVNLGRLNHSNLSAAVKLIEGGGVGSGDLEGVVSSAGWAAELDRYAGWGFFIFDQGKEGEFG